MALTLTTPVAVVASPAVTTTAGVAAVGAAATGAAVVGRRKIGESVRGRPIMAYRLGERDRCTVC